MSVRDDLQSAVAQALSVMAAQENTITRQTAELAELRSQLAAVRRVPLIGSSAKPGSVEAFMNLEAAVGKLQAWRIFVPGPVLDASSIAKVKACTAGGRRPVLSVSGVTNIAEAASYAHAAATALRDILIPRGASITFGHEPTQKFTDRAGYVAAKDAFYRIIGEALPAWDRLDILMLHDLTTGGDRHPDLWVAHDGLLDAIGFDCYDQGKRSFQEMIAPAVTYAKSKRLPLWIPETATVPAGKAAWITAAAAYARTEPTLAGWLWFHSDIGPNTPSAGWYVNSPPEAAVAFRTALQEVS